VPQKNNTPKLYFLCPSLSIFIKCKLNYRSRGGNSFSVFSQNSWMCLLIQAPNAGSISSLFFLAWWRGSSMEFELRASHLLGKHYILLWTMSICLGWSQTLILISIASLIAGIIEWTTTPGIFIEMGSRWLFAWASFQPPDRSFLRHEPPHPISIFFYIHWK
jgi:hypothetical protein